MLKTAVAGIAHKSDAGGVKLNLHNRDDVAVAYEAIMASCKQHVPGANIVGVIA